MTKNLMPLLLFEEWQLLYTCGVHFRAGYNNIWCNYSQRKCLKVLHKPISTPVEISYIQYLWHNKEHELNEKSNISWQGEMFVLREREV